MEKILPIRQTRSIDHHKDTVENFWVFHAAPNDPPEATASFPAHLKRILSSRPDVLLVAAAQIQHPELLQAMHHTAQQGARVYLLTGERIAAKELAGNCLMRFGLALHGALILANPGTHARGMYVDDALTSAALDSPATQVLELDPDQCNLAYQFFCHHFWQSARTEILDKKGDATPVPAHAPFSVLPPTDHMQTIRDLLSSGAIKSCALRREWPLTQLKGAAILTSSDVENPIAIGGANSLYCNNVQVPLQYVMADGRSYLLPKSAMLASQNALVLPLNTAQASFYQARYTQLKQAAECAFIPRFTRGELVNQRIQRIGIDTEPRLVMATADHQEDIRPGSFMAKAALQQLQPAFTWDTLACTIQHHWTTHPYSLPAYAKEDPLYQQWQDKHAQVRKTMSTLAEKLQALQNTKTQISVQLLNRLKQVFLGKEQRWGELAQELAQLHSTELDKCTRETYLNVIQALNRIAQQIDNTGRELKAQTAHAEKTQEWEARGREIEARIESLQNQVEAQVKANEAATKKDEEELTRRKAGLEAFCAENNIPIAKLPTLKSQWEHDVGKKNQKKNASEAAKATKMLEMLAPHDLSVFQARCKSDRETEKKRLDKAQNDLNQAEEDLQKHQARKPSLIIDPEHAGKSSELDQLQQPAKATQTSKHVLSEDLPEQLPHTGRLYTHDKQRYLAITYWQEAEAGEKEASRLKAKLCTHP